MIDQELQPITPEIITSGVVEVVSFYDKMDPREAVSELLDGEHVLVEDYYHNGLQILEQLRNYLKRKHDRTTFQGKRAFRGAYQEISGRLLLLVVDHELLVKKSPDIGWFTILFPEEDQFLISFPDVQGLNSSWQWYTNGIEIDELDLTLHPYYGVYFPTRFEHLELFGQWLEEYDGDKTAAMDIGVGSGVLSFQLLQHGFSEVIATDTNPNAIISTAEDSDRLDLTDRLTLCHGDLYAGYDGKVDLIVFNPPWLEADHELEEGIDTAIYYQPGLFARFFDQVDQYLREDGKLVLLFSNLGAVVDEGTLHPVKNELEHNERFQESFYKKKQVTASSQQTRRKDWREHEQVEIWVLSYQ